MDQLLRGVLKSVPAVVEQAKRKNVAGAIGALDDEVFEVTEKQKVARNIHQAVLAPLQYAQGAKVTAAQNLTNSLRFEHTEPFFKMADKILKTDRRARSSDRLGVKVLKHRTTTEAGRKIAASRQMRLGREGVLGGGIYFAEDEEATKVKAVNGTNRSQPYAMVTANVDLGHCRIVRTGEREWRMICDGGFDKDALEKLGYQSVGSYFNGGWEYCVFDPSRVTVIGVEHREPGSGSGA